MKLARFFLTVLILGLSSSVLAQGIQITPYVGYQFGGKIRLRQGEMKIDPALNYGGSIDIALPFRDGMHIHMFYIRQDSELSLRQPPSPEAELFDITTEYWQIGILHDFDIGSIVPFGSFTLGAAVFNPKQADTSTETRFAVSFGGG